MRKASNCYIGPSYKKVETLSNIQDDIKSVLEKYQFQFNNSTTIAKIVQEISEKLDKYKAQGLISDDYEIEEYDLLFHNDQIIINLSEDEKKKRKATEDLNIIDHLLETYGNWELLKLKHNIEDDLYKITDDKSNNE